ncbi:hypothetical protein TrLO_g2576 [Triparma laevis f. longispina]|uniref:Alanine--tRNA ligase n=1 Tax=Triparma laevis f. longispina TaxID=1714387 RepID=A0A9W6ZTB9_9STRA|nr:hypothetical protein TrLO_g2576 [Triparma laevis f. longispina]
MTPEEINEKMEGITFDHPTWPMSKIRQSFIDFYVQKHSHVFWPSSPCVPHDDPTLLFANAGMNQYKPLFLGTCDPALEMSKLKRATNTQKCIRAGGKHNDLDDVGKDVYHHTFFEMMGNWSFGDYFKEGAIDMSWQCLTEVYSLDTDRLYATYFGGDEKTPADEEAKKYLLKHLPASRVLPFDAHDNFWEMGATGPCGPCVEFHYDRIGGRDAADLVNADLPDVIEIWNNVFIQYNREAGGELRDLPAQHIDTGMGFERLASILQGFDSNYDTDIFMPIFKAIEIVTGASPYTGKVGEKEDMGFKDMAYRVVADHLRTLTFAIADGAIPSNDGRGYVLRRVLRRAVRYGRQNLGAELGFFSTLVPTLVKLMGDAFPEIRKREEFVINIIKEEETSFSRTLDKGLTKFNDMVKVTEGGVFSGANAHFLYTSMGFPVDLTELMCEEKGLKLDVAGFDAKMKEEQELSQAAHKAKMSGGSGKEMVLEAEQTAALVTRGCQVTESEAKYTWNADIDSKISAAFIGRGETDDKTGFVDSITTASGAAGLIFDATNFYAEQGGQIYDQGTVTCGDAVFRVDNVQVFGGYVLHLGEVVKGTFSVGSSATLAVNYIRRGPIASNHTMTHVLNYALRDVMIGKENIGSDDGPQLDQKGSLVDDQKLRFDFSWGSQVTVDQLAKIEAKCLAQIQQNIKVHTFNAPLADASQISALRAVFGEKYPDPVRVVSVCDTPIPEILKKPTEEIWKDYSIEFCGGTHLDKTGEAEAFVILSEEGIAKGIRRITAVTQERAREATNAARGFALRVKAAEEMAGAELQDEAKKLKLELQTLSISCISKHDLGTALNGLQAKVKEWQTKQMAAKVDGAAEACKTSVEAAKAAGKNKCVVRYDFGCDGKTAQKILKAVAKDVAVMIFSADAGAGKYGCFASSPKVAGVDCKKWIADAFDGIGGRGGGKPANAQWQVEGLDSLDAAVTKAGSI